MSDRPSWRGRTLRGATALLAAAALTVPAAAPAHAHGGHHRGPFFPTTLDLPDGFMPEGIAIGGGPFAYFGSLADGDIYRADLVTGRGRVISEGPGTQSVGLELDRRGRLFVAGGEAGDARVVDVHTGDVVASYQLQSDSSFVNDVIVTPEAVWFTDSFQPVLYRLPLGRHGALPAPEQVETVPLRGDFEQLPEFNANGISRTPDRTGLLVVQTNTGLLFRVDPDTGEASQVDLGGEVLEAADGLLLHGSTLFVVQNQLNQVAVVELSHRGERGVVVDQLTDPRFDVPTTVADFGSRLYLPNAQFIPDATPETPYNAVAIPKPRR